MVVVPGDPSNGLRERKKAQTRLAIRREAFRLFIEQGYGNTTVEQIAEAANVSPRTFYRYFRVKEALLVSDDHSAPSVAAFVAAPPELSIAAAYRHAINEVFGGLTPEEREDAILGQRLLYQVPEARGLVYSEYARLIDRLTDALGERIGADTDPLERRVLAGAITGILIAVSHDNPLPQEQLSEAMTILERRLT